MRKLQEINGPYVSSIGWIVGPNGKALSGHRDMWGKVACPFDLNQNGIFKIKRVEQQPENTVISPETFKASGVARARSAAKSTVYAALLAKKLRTDIFEDSLCKNLVVGILVASGSSITGIAWDFENVGVSRGWENTDTMLLPSSIPSAIATQLSAALGTHGAAIAFQDGAFGICAAMQHAHVSMQFNRLDYAIVIGAEEAVKVQTTALSILGDDNASLNGAFGMLLSRISLEPLSWKLVLCANVVEPYAFSSAWANAMKVDLSIAGKGTLYTSLLIPYAIHEMLVKACGRAVLTCKIENRGTYILGFSQE